MTERLAGKVVLVTGGTSGIGEAVARRVVAEGVAVVVGARRAEAGRALVAELGERAVFVRADVTVEADAEALVAAAVRELGRLDVAVNNAGTVTAGGPVQGIDADAWAADLASNLTSVFYGLKHQIPALTEGGSIVNNASIGATTGIPGMSPYVAAKHGVIGLTRSVALECAARGVRVNALVTGNVDTPLYRGLLHAGPDDDLGEAPNPSQRTAAPAEIAAFVAFLLSDEARFITGAALPIDGGATAG
ncbi:SDR family NAD(P)-dependent oxidoreductase [Lentzea sp. NPDC059081]|uniref:SDR family NAD(P)-dependent oxidoreductase n=1 Tax=Lentzea sp. NPDC059081 TaxID=3346719 RepID=UPI00367D0C9B